MGNPVPPVVARHRKGDSNNSKRGVNRNLRKNDKKTAFFFEQNNIKPGLDIMAIGVLIGGSLGLNFGANIKLFFVARPDFGGGFVQTAAGKPLRLQLY
jgi:acyl-homoserine lactone acylase PvdQ